MLVPNKRPLFDAVPWPIIISATKDEIWAAISDIKNASKIFKDIKKITIITQPGKGILGTKWEETREFMGKESSEIMWISEVQEMISYVAEAKNSGCLYHSSMILHDCDEGVIVTKTFHSTPETFLAKIMLPLMLLMHKTLKKCLQKDLEDLKSYIEQSV